MRGPCRTPLPDGPKSICSLIPVRPVAAWIEGVLKFAGWQVISCKSTTEFVRLTWFARLDAVVLWLPATDLEALGNTLDAHGQLRPSLVILSHAPLIALTIRPWFKRDVDEALSLPVSSSKLIRSVSRVLSRNCPLGSPGSRAEPTPMLDGLIAETPLRAGTVTRPY